MWRQAEHLRITIECSALKRKRESLSTAFCIFFGGMNLLHTRMSDLMIEIKFSDGPCPAPSAIA